MSMVDPEPPTDASNTQLKPSRLNLGCGDDYREDMYNVDIDPTVDPDAVVDLQDTPWPWEADRFSVIHARHVLEHLDPVPWHELTRVLRPQGELTVVYPIGHTRFEDGSHKQFWNVHTSEWISGDRRHAHEGCDDLTFMNRDVEWWIRPPSTILEYWTRYRLWRYGPGPWLGQVPGLCGEVRATYRKTTDEWRVTDE